ncbi:MAG: 3-deoxy-manno-octulosonate cytidylyltransferase [Candidatus Omnitrophica bacterium]|nr:3-deoxy-manno-octulosonate cytidylyltransferase [Candidatus Omnitrophota bacterium]
MKITAIIPVRMQATRFSGKPLALILGLPMVEHVRRRVSLCRELSNVIVATCDQEIKEVVEKAGGKVIMTADTHQRCTDRIAEAARNIDADIIINVQGDEPLVIPEMMNAVIEPFLSDLKVPCVNMIAPILEKEEFEDPNAPKVVRNLKGDILYISREPIPSKKKAAHENYPKWKQLGLIAFRSDFLQTFARLKPTLLEEVESVDMMRAIEHGFRVRTVVTEAKMIGVDVPADVGKVEQVLRTDPLFERYMSRSVNAGQTNDERMVI